MNARSKSFRNVTEQLLKDWMENRRRRKNYRFFSSFFLLSLESWRIMEYFTSAWVQRADVTFWFARRFLIFTLPAIHYSLLEFVHVGR